MPKATITKVNQVKEGTNDRLRKDVNKAVMRMYGAISKQSAYMGTLHIALKKIDTIKALW